MKHNHLLLAKFLLVSFYIFSTLIINAQTSTPPAAGDGTEANPYQIETLDNLYWLLQSDTEWDKHYIQTADIDASSTNSWDDGAGIASIGNETTYFIGSYNGQGHSIENLYMNRPALVCAGLFSRIDGGSVTALHLVNAYIRAERNVGGLVGYLISGIVNSCSVTGEVISYSYYPFSQTGGLVGYNNGTIEQCFTSCVVTGNKTNVGGLVGVNKGIISDCYSICTVSANEGFYAGLISKSEGWLYNSYSASVDANGDPLQPFGPSLGNEYNCFWNSEGAKEKGNTTGITTAEMQEVETFLNSGWDFVGEGNNGNEDIWGINCNENNGYPFLMFQNYAYSGTAPVANEASLPDASGGCIVNAIDAPTATDDCGRTIIGVSDVEFPIGQPTTVTWTYTDYSGNTSTQTQNVITVEDNTAPTISCIENQSVTVTAHQWYTVIGTEFDPIETNDDCGVASVINDYTNTETLEGAEISEGETTIIWTVTDYADNTNTCSTLFTVYYNETPEGDGSQANPFQIANLDNLNWLMINDQHWGKFFIQTSDIDATSTNTWSEGNGITSIGNGTTNFSGSYDGQGYKIDGLYMNRTSNSNTGLFGRVNGGSITNLHLTNIYIKANRNVGGLVGYLDSGNISACSVTGEVISFSSESYSQSGGFVGYNNQGIIDQCFADCTVSGNKTNIGVLIGVNKGSLTNSYTFGSASCNEGYVGRLVAKNIGSVENCYSAAGQGSGSSIGLFGTNSGTSTNCFWDTNASKIKSNGTGLTTIEMQDVQTYLNAGWDFIGENSNGIEDAWGINCNENNGYPFLMFQDYAYSGTAPVANEASLPDVSGGCIVNAIAAPTATDNCGRTIIGVSDVEFPIGQPTTVTWTYTDYSGNTSTQTQNVITVEDNTPPTISCVEDQNITITASHGYIVIGTEFDPIETNDDCGVASVINDYTNTETLEGAEIGEGETPITWTVTDYAGNINTCTTTITITNTAVPEGNGSEENPYQIETLVNLNWLMNNDQQWDKHYIQTADIDASSTNSWDDGAGFPTIGNGTTYFTGSYDGQGYEIEGLYMNRPTLVNAGLFGRIDGGSVTALHLTNVNISANRNVGGLVGYLMSGNVSSCSVTGEVISISTSTFSQSGGLVAYNMGTINQCFTDITLIGNKTNVGGISGVNKATISNSYSLGQITCDDGTAGSIVGNNMGTVENCFAANSITSPYFGGIAGGSNWDYVINCFWDTEVAGYTSGIGTPLSSIEMKNAFNYIDAGWDFASENANGDSNYWGMNCADNNGYPFLIWQGFAQDDIAPVPDIAVLDEIVSDCQVNSVIAPTSTDACDGSIIGVSDLDFPLTQSAEIIWTFFDTDGNTTTQTQNVVIQDDIAPIPDEENLADITSECSISDLTSPTATDNCNGQIVGVHNVTLPITEQGTTVVTWTYTDDNANSTTQTQNVVIEDTTAPVPDNTILADITAECELTELSAPTATDNCSGIVDGTHNVTLPISTQGTTVVTWTYTDNFGNSTTQTQNVIIDDATQPTLTCASNLTVNANSEGYYTVQGAELDPTDVDDNCGVASVLNDYNDAASLANAQVPEGTHTITWTVTDNADNTNTCSLDLTVNAHGTGVANLQQAGINLYPNPTAQMLTVELGQNKALRLTVTDLTGRVVLTKENPTQTETLDLSPLSNGVYLLVVQTNGKVLSTRVVKK